MSGQQTEKTHTVRGPFTSGRTVETWWWERPNNQGSLGYSRPEILKRCQRIWGGRIGVIRMVETSVTTVHDLTPRAPGRPDAQCAILLGRGRYCRLPVGHEGDCEPSTRRAGGERP